MNDKELADLLMSHPAYAGCRYKKILHAVGLMTLAGILFAGIATGTLNGAPDILMSTLAVISVCIILAIRQIKTAGTVPDDIRTGVVENRRKISRLSGNSACENDRRYGSMKHGLDWEFGIRLTDGSMVWARRMESVLSDTHSISNGDIPDGMIAVTFKVWKNTYCVFCNDDDGDIPDDNAEDTAPDDVGIPDVSIEEETDDHQ